MKFFFRKFGQGFPLVILHGLYGCSDNWIPIGKQLSSYFEVYIPDLRNHGQSPHNEIHNYSALKDDLHDFFEDLKIEKAIIMGHSMGGKIAMLFTNEFPEKVNKLIVVDIFAKSYNEENSKIINHKLILETLLNFDLQKLTSFTEAEKLLSEMIEDKRLIKFLVKNIKKNENNRFEWKLNLSALYANIQLIADGFDANELKKQEIPVLFLKGENSDYIKSEDFEIIKHIYLNSRIVTINNSGHWLHAEQPEIFITEVLNFIQ